jgi:magnesium transporter
MINYFYRSVRGERLAKLDQFRVGAWIHVEAPTREELDELTAKFKLDPDMLRDALDPDEIPRLEVEDGIAYAFMRYAYKRGDTVDTDPVLLAAGPDFVASISRHALPGADRFMNIPELFTTQRLKLLLLLLRHVVVSYELHLKQLDRQIRGVRAKLNVENINNRDFVAFVVIEDALNSFLSDLVPENLLLQSLLSSRYGLAFHEEDKDLVEDLAQATRQLIESSRASLQTIVNIREAYATIMANNLNKIFKMLTSITILMTIPTIVTSIYSMNIALPLMHNPAVFYVISAIILGAMGIAAWWFRRNKWF